MALITSFLVLDAIIIVVSLFLLLYWYQTKNYNYWKVRKVSYLEPNWIFGNIKGPLLRKTTWGDFSKDCYSAFRDKGFGGIFVFRYPAIFICDPNLVDNVLVQDFDHFRDRTSMWSPHEKLSKSLYDSTGETWRTLRYNLMPTFTLGKLKGMFKQILNCSNHTLHQIAEQTKLKKPIDVEPLIFEFTIEAIASCTFGVQLCSKSADSKSFKSTLDLIIKASVLRLSASIYAVMHSKIIRILRINVMPKPVMEFFTRLTEYAIKYRKENGIERTDFLQLMLKLKDQEEKGNGANNSSCEDVKATHLQAPTQELTPGEKVFTQDCIASQIFEFMFAGSNPSVGTVTFALFEIAQNPSIQRKMQKEIDWSIMKHKGLNLSTLKEMTYLDQVIQETLRRYSHVDLISRVVTEPYTLPGTDLTLEKGLVVLISHAALHMDPQYYPEPEQFNPERFAGNNYKPGPLFLPFGHGPRMCIAIKFAVLMMKVCLARILSTYNVKLSSEMTLPLRFDVDAIFANIKGGLWLNFDKRAECYS